MVRAARLHDHDSPLRVEDVELAAPAVGAWSAFRLLADRAITGKIILDLG